MTTVLQRSCEACAYYEEWRVYVGESPWGGVRECARCLKHADDQLHEWGDDDCPDFEERMDGCP